MARLPIFPLHTVLFPGVPIRLHIFEERYKRMIQRCVSEHLEFGVVLIDSGQEALGPLARPRNHGTTAAILQLETLEGGRINLMAVGNRRFEILELDPESESYLQGEVQILEPTAGDAAEDRAAAGLVPLIEEYLELLSPGAGGSQDFSQLPRDARTLCYACAYLLQVSPVIKQDLLEIPSTGELIERSLDLYQKQIAILKHLRQQNGPSHSDGYSVN